MLFIESPKVEKPDIHPLSMEEINLFLDNVPVRYHNFFVVAFFSGMRLVRWRHWNGKMWISN